jgi:hypothetical protein
MPLSTLQIVSFAPIVKIHPQERYYPMDPLDFISKSRFRHHRGGQQDQGYNKHTDKWVDGNSKAAAYYNISVSVINSYKCHPNGKNRRPRDPKSGHDHDVFLQPDGHPRGCVSPNGAVPAFYYCWQRNGVELIGYWWFMGYNDGPSIQNHQGDWEHVTFRVKDGSLQDVCFAAHGRPARPIDSACLNRKGGRVLVYCAKGTHASYEKAGQFPLRLLNLPLPFHDETADGGYEWSITQNLHPLDSQPWRDYAGAWGEVGESKDTTGPLGPWHKRNKL